MHFAHIGDSRIYHFPQEEGMTQITQDDTHVAWLRSQGKLNEREVRMHPRRNVLSKALGAGHQFMEPQLGSVRVDPGDAFLFCTDGIIDGLWDSRLQEMVRERAAEQGSPSLAQRLVEEALAGSGKDNTTAVVVEVL
jgi:protein phosphatase